MTAPLYTELAKNSEDILASQQLRYQIFAGEQGATLDEKSEHFRFDHDHYDPYCHHLLVREQGSQKIVGSTRILTQSGARDAGSFYSENEFDLRYMFPNLMGNVIEIGRTCIHPDYRNGVGIYTLWSGLAQFIETHNVDFMFGCASVSLRDGGRQATALVELAAKKHQAPAKYRVTPRLKLLPMVAADELKLPPLLKAYLKLGAWIAGEPCIDPDFNVADFFILLDVSKLSPRYQRHYLQVKQHPLHGNYPKPTAANQHVVTYPQ